MKQIIHSLDDLEPLRKRMSGDNVYHDIGMGMTLMGLVWAHRPNFIVEYGTLTGYSASCMGLALKQIGYGHLLTIDNCSQSPEAKEVHKFRKWLKNTDLDNYIESIIGVSWEEGPRQIERLGNKEVDMVFIDGDHTKSGVIKDFNSLQPYITQDCLFMFHDYYHMQSVKDAINSLFVDELWNVVILPTQGNEQARYGMCGLVLAMRRTEQSEITSVKRAISHGLKVSDHLKRFCLKLG